MLDFDAKGTVFSYDPATGYRTYGGGHYGSAFLRFVGVAYGMNGSAVLNAGAASNPNPVNNKLYAMTAMRAELRVEQFGERNLGEMSDLPLRAYRVDLNHEGDAKISFHNATLEIPIKTQA